MANTLNLGNGDWATKENSLLGYNSENGNFKPLPFDFTRASNGTFVNKSGLIETAANGVPRIDFSDSTSGALLLEPQRTNSLLQSNQFNTTWATSSGVTITSEQTISPQGINNGWKFEKTAAAYKSIGQSYTSSNETTFSIFAKKGTLSVITLFTNISGGTNLYQRFDLENGIVSTGAGMSSSNIKDYGNGWYRCSSTFTNASVTSLDFFAEFSENNAGYIYMYGAQAEQGSYATSLINTQGSAVTRVADACSQTPPSGIIGQTEGTVYAEAKIDGLKNSNTIVTLHNGSFSEYLVISGNISGNINAYIFAGGVQQAGIFSGIYAVDSVVKCAMAYKQNDVAFYINGVLIGTDSSATMASTSNFDVGSISFGNYTLHGSVKETKLYNTRLSNAELQALTTI
jgi:hypothetical protein